MELYQKLEEVYSHLGVLKNPLHSKCKHSSLCWNGVDANRICKDHEPEAQLYLPYIGENYNVGKILALGINMHEYGGYDAEKYLANKAIAEIKEGKIKTFANEKYKGSLVWHRILSYSTFILREVGTIELPASRPYPEKEELSNAFKYIAVSNSIKCCPWGDRSKPTNEMWNKCPDFILKEEISVLKPKHIIVLGNNNYNRIVTLFNNPIIKEEGSTKVVKVKFEDYEICIYAFPHPSSSQGASIIRMDELERLLMKEYAKQ